MRKCCYSCLCPYYILIIYKTLRIKTKINQQQYAIKRLRMKRNLNLKDFNFKNHVWQNMCARELQYQQATKLSILFIIM